jgi:hypothetical protein
MKLIHAFMIAAFAAAPLFVPCAHAVVTQKVTDDTFAAFNGGEFTNVSLSSDGHMELAPSMASVADMTDPIIWAAVEDKKGDLFLGTGNQGKVYKLTPKGELTTFFEPSAVMVHALAIDEKGRLYVATSPNGCVYRLDADGRTELFCNPGETYIWAMLFGKDGSLYLATGSQGKILRMPPSGSTPVKTETYFETKEANITALALDNDGNLLAGTSPHGYLYRIDKANHGFVVFNSSEKEIKQIVVATNGVIYASTFASGPQSDETGGAGSVTISISPAGSNGTSAGTSHAKPKSDSSDDAPSTDDDDDAVVTVGDASSMAAIINGGESGEGKSMGAIYRIDTNGFCDRYWNVPGEAIYSMAFLPDGTLLAGTGDKGRIYSIADANHWKLLQEAASGSQVAVLLPDTREPKQLYAATSQPGGIYRLDLALAPEGSYTSEPFDAKQKSQWGKLHPIGEVPDGAKLEFSTRSGNTEKPEKTWSEWSAPQPLGNEIAVASPNARYLQYRVEFQRAGSPGETASLRRVEYYYQNLNAPPVISRVKVHNEGINIAKTPMPQMDGPGASLSDLLGGDAASSKGPNPMAAIMANMAAMQQLKTTKTRGYCTVVWDAKDPNDDALTYSVFIRAVSDSQWTTLVDKTGDTFYSFDTTGFPGGYYLIKVTASDLPSNTPETARAAEAVSEPFLINNAAPVLTVQSQSVEKNHTRIVVNAVAVSVIQSASYSLDGKEDVALRPGDLIFDSTNETLVVELDSLSKGNHSLLVHAQDEMQNTAVLQLNFEVK